LCGNVIPALGLQRYVHHRYSVNIQLRRIDHGLWVCRKKLFSALNPNRHYFANHIIHVTRARSFDLRVPEAMSTHARLAKTTLVYCVAHTWLVPTPYVNLDMSSPLSSWPASYRRTFVVIAHIRENTIIWYWLGIILSYATVVYLNTSTNKIYTITSNINIVWYDMVLHRRAWSPLSDPAWSPSFHQYGTTSMVSSSWSCS
jgi:hypothetical protein